MKRQMPKAFWAGEYSPLSTEVARYVDKSTLAIMDLLNSTIYKCLSYIWGTIPGMAQKIKDAIAPLINEKDQRIKCKIFFEKRDTLIKRHFDKYRNEHGIQRYVSPFDCTCSTFWFSQGSESCSPDVALIKEAHEESIMLNIEKKLRDKKIYFERTMESVLRPHLLWNIRVFRNNCYDGIFYSSRVFVQYIDSTQEKLVAAFPNCKTQWGEFSVWLKGEEDIDKIVACYAGGHVAS